MLWIANGGVKLFNGQLSHLGESTTRSENLVGLARNIPGYSPALFADDQRVGYLGQNGEVGLDDRCGKVFQLLGESEQ